MLRFIAKRAIRPCHECRHYSHDGFRDICFCECPGVVRHDAKVRAKPTKRIECALARGTLQCVLGEEPAGEGER